MGERFILPPVITASKWNTVGVSLWEDLRKKRGTSENMLGLVSYKMTNREAVAIINATRALAPMLEHGFPLWYQFAAVAYGWTPGVDKLDATQKQADQLYDPDAGFELQRAVNSALIDMRDRHPDVPPRLELEKDMFDEPIFQGEVARALHADGVRPQFEIPLPVCKDKKTGKLRVPRPPCDKDGKGPVEPITGRRMPCDKPGDCAPATVDDPLSGIIRGIGKFAVPLAFIVIAAAVFATPRRGRRRRY